MKGEQFMNNNVLNHDFGYGNSTIFKDSDIKKLKIEDINDLKLYIEDLLVSQLIDATIINGILKSRAFPDVQITIELE